ncbi:hypothetical protein C5167_048345 [Papaver somniferum]|uniref:Uncharacterized protein n=1 Tax=Papaver somniferum TaxID=3469 RepID=A0A4Y7KKL3_PAPSO|nr:hypothetical protein C5167_048345 [Papaver somniferum]
MAPHTRHVSFLQDSAVWQMLHEGTRSLLVQPVPGDPNSTAYETTKKIGGFILLASCMSYTHIDRDSVDRCKKLS